MSEQLTIEDLDAVPVGDRVTDRVGDEWVNRGPDGWDRGGAGVMFATTDGLLDVFGPLHWADDEPAGPTLHSELEALRDRMADTGEAEPATLDDIIERHLPRRP